MNFQFKIAAFVALLGSGCTLRAQERTVPVAAPKPESVENITFPADGRIVNVREAPYGARGDGKTDDTAAFQKALEDHAARSFTCPTEPTF